MREAAYITANLFKNEHLNLLNETINQNIVKGSDQPSGGAIKSSQVKFIRLIIRRRRLLFFSLLVKITT